MENWSLTLVTFRPVDPREWGDGEKIRDKAEKLIAQGRTVIVRNARGCIIPSCSNASAL